MSNVNDNPNVQIEPATVPTASANPSATTQPSPGKSWRRRLLTTAGIGALITIAAANPTTTSSLVQGAVSFATQMAAAATPATDDVQAANPGPARIAVDLTTPAQRQLIEWDTFTGRFVPAESVAVHARVSGYLERIHFTDGQLVRAGDPLFTIDRRPFETALAEAEAALAGARARLANARDDNHRGQRLVTRGTISQAIADDREQAQREAEAAVMAAEARVARAKLDLSFTEIRAPISGRISDNAVSEGALVVEGSSSGTLLTNIVSLNPIEFEFTVSEADYLKYTRLDAAGAGFDAHTNPNPVRLKLMDEADFGHHGEMRFVDNQMNGSTGTMRLRAVFQNPDSLFTPGMFARVQIAGSKQYTAVIVSDAAIQTDQAEKFVWVAKPSADGFVATRRAVTLGPEVSDGRIVRSGLDANDRVVLGGTQFLTAGASLQPVPPKPGKLASAAAQ